MGPSRSRAQGASKAASAGTPLDSIPKLTTDVQSAVAEVQGGGQDQLKAILVGALAPADTALASIPLSHCIITLLRSSLGAAEIASVVSAVVDGLEEARKEEQVGLLGEALVDAVEVLDEEAQDVADLQSTEGMEVDSTTKPSDKGIELVKLLMESSHIPSYIPNLLFSPDILLKLSLHPAPRDPKLLQRAYIKRNTTLFFKQSKYNLLRESSEGFSALIVLLTSADALIPDHREESDEDRTIRSKRVWDKVMGLVGYFNLSPPRVLDLILEIASCQVAAHWRFFLDLLRSSPWGASSKAGDAKGKGKEMEGWLKEEVGSISHVLDAGGDRNLAQVLGVKLGFYQRQDGGDTPPGLVYMAALLIKHKFISLSDILPFMSPDDAQMEKIRNDWKTSVSSKSGPQNALSMSVLLDDDAPDSATAKAEDSGPPPKPPPEQRIVLLQALLAIGDIPSALYFLARFPWLAQSHPAIADLIMRIVAHAMDGVYRSIYPQAIPDRDNAGLDLQAPVPGYVEPVRDVIATFSVPQPPATQFKQFEFFYPDWSQQVEQWTSTQDLFDKGLRWLGLVRGLAGRDVATMVKICRMGAAHFAKLQKEKAVALGFDNSPKTKAELRQLDPTSEELKPWLDVIRTSLLPALSVSSASAPFDVELWNLLRFFPYPVRYALYGEWRDSTCNFRGRNSCLVAAQAAAESTRDIKKALSRVTAAQSGPGGQPAVVDRGPARALAKLSHSNPLALWTTAVTQVKAYPNIGQFIVEAGRYMTPLSTDVAMFTLVDTLSDDTVSRLNPNGTDVAQWLSSLATFVGDFNRRYASMDLEPVLQFIINRLMRSQSADLTILDHLIAIMSGVSQVENDAVSEDQLRAYAAGKEMVHEAFHSTLISIPRPVEGTEVGAKSKEAPGDKAKSTKKSLPRLVNALRDTELAMPIWIALAQTRQAAVDKMASAPIKAMAAMQDTVHGTFIQYGDLLAEHLTADEHIKLTPDLESLVSDFGLDFAMAFQILRPRLNDELARGRAEKEAAMRLRIEAAKEAGQKTPTPLASPTSVIADLPNENGDVEMGDGPAEAAEDSSVPAPKTASVVRSWYPSPLRPAMEQARDLLPPDANSSMGAPFFVIFWHLAMSDIAFSPESYDKAIAKINAMDRDIASWRTANGPDQKAERARLKAKVDVLSKEKEAQATLVAATRRRLVRESKHWFGSYVLEKNLQRKLSQQLHQHCFFPRALLTPADAVFVAKFIRLAHDLGTVGFSTLFVYTNFFGDHLAGSIFSCTTNEARNLGRCLAAIMSDLDGWHQDEKRYRREALGLDREGEGEEAKELPGMMFRSKSSAPLAAMTWSQFRDFYAKAHNTLTKALVSCWAQTDFMHIKNAITVGLQVIKSFPVMESNGKAIQNAVQDLIAGKNGTLTPDVQHQCQAYLRLLKQRQTAKPYVAPHIFHPNGPKPPAPKPKAPKPAASVKEPVEPGAKQVKPASVNAAANGNGNGTPTRSDPKALRAKLEETRTRAAQNKAAEAKASASPAPDTTVASNVDKPAPTGPRATRNIPTGPAADTSTASTNSPRPAESSMGPPATDPIAAERAAARARRFGMLQQPVGGASGAASPAGSETGPASRNQSPAPRRRSRSVESRNSERSRRSRRDGRDRREDRSDAGTETKESVDSESKAAEEGEKRKHDEGRRSSRDSSRRHGDERERERDDRRRSDRKDDSQKRKREEEPRDRDRERRDDRHRHESSRREDDRRDRDRRSERDDRDRSKRRERERDSRDPRDARDARDARAGARDARDAREGHRDARDAPREPGREGGRDAPRDARDARDREQDRVGQNRNPRDDRRDREPRGPRGGAATPTVPNGRAGDRTPRNESASNTNARELLPSAPAAPSSNSAAPPTAPSANAQPQGDRIVEAPRSTRPAARPSSAGHHSLPARPGGPPAASTPSAPSSGGLADRLGPASAQTPDSSRAPENQSPVPSRPSSDRKRPLENETPVRDDSPGSSKRVKIDRSKARDHDRRGREAAGQNRQLSNAMRGGRQER